MSLLALLAERCDGLDGVFAGIGQEGYVAQVAYARAGEVGMAEAVDLIVVVVITAAGVPSHDVRVGAQLHHGVRTGGAGEGVSVKTGSYKGVNMLCLVC